MKKAQTEIIGLLVIVILFIFVGLIYIMFSGGDDESLTRDVTQSTKAQNMLDAFVQVTPCYTTTPYEQMEKIIANCYTSSGQVCGQDCETLITGTLAGIMQAYNQHQDYEFKIIKPDNSIFITYGTSCTGDTRVATDKLIAGGQVLTLKLIYCV